MAAAHRISEITDSAVLDIAWRHAKQIHIKSFVLAILFIVFVAAEYTLSLVREGLDRDEELEISPSHPFKVPRWWRDMLVAMWQQRIRRAGMALENSDADLSAELRGIAESGSWRTDWSQWSRCVIVVQALSMAARKEAATAPPKARVP